MVNELSSCTHAMAPDWSAACSMRWLQWISLRLTNTSGVEMLLLLSWYTWPISRYEGYPARRAIRGMNIDRRKSYLWTSRFVCPNSFVKIELQTPITVWPARTILSWTTYMNLLTNYLTVCSNLILQHIYQVDRLHWTCKEVQASHPCIEPNNGWGVTEGVSVSKDTIGWQNIWTWQKATLGSWQDTILDAYDSAEQWKSSLYQGLMTWGYMYGVLANTRTPIHNYQDCELGLTILE